MPAEQSEGDLPVVVLLVDAAGEMAAPTRNEVVMVKGQSRVVDKVGVATRMVPRIV